MNYPTYNQLMNWRKTNQYINLIDTLPPEILHRYRSYQGRKISFNNILYSLAANDFKKLGNEIKVYEHFDLDTFEPLAGSEIFQRCPRVYVHTWMYCSSSFEIEFSVKNLLTYPSSSKEQSIGQNYSIVPPKNMELTEANVIKTVQDWVNKNILYAPGVFRDMQYLNNWSKQYVKEWYKKYITADLQAFNENDIYKWIARKFNLGVKSWSIDDAIKIVNKLGRQKTFKNVHAFDMSFIHDFEGNIDEAEQMFNSEYNKQCERNTILV